MIGLFLKLAIAVATPVVQPALPQIPAAMAVVGTIRPALPPPAIITVKPTEGTIRQALATMTITVTPPIQFVPAPALPQK